MRQTIEADQSDTLEGEFASKTSAGAGLTTLVAPDGAVQSGLKALILYDYRRVNPETGEPVVVHEPVIVLRRSSLTRVPLAGEKWEIRFPISPRAGAPIASFLLDGKRAPEGGETIGFIRLYPVKVGQS